MKSVLTSSRPMYFFQAFGKIPSFWMSKLQSSLRFFVFVFFLHAKYVFHKFSSIGHMGTYQSTFLNLTFEIGTIGIDTIPVGGLSGLTSRTCITSWIGLTSTDISPTLTLFCFFSSMVDNFCSLFLLKSVGCLELSYST